MDFLGLVKTRRSIRSFSDKPLPLEDLIKCSEAGRFAPSACNSQEWKFIIINEKEQLAEISTAALSGAFKMNSFASGATGMIAIVSENIKLPAWVGGKLRGTDFSLIDIGIACEHIVLQAHELGIGTCILGWFDERKLKKILNVPRSRRVKLVIAMGYPESPASETKKLKENTVCLGSYSQTSKKPVPLAGQAFYSELQ